MACSITPILMDIDCPKEGVFTRAQTLWGKVERVERGHEKGTIYLEGKITFQANTAIPKWIKPGIRVEVNICDGETTIQQVK